MRGHAVCSSGSNTGTHPRTLPVAGRQRQIIPRSDTYMVRPFPASPKLSWRSVGGTHISGLLVIGHGLLGPDGLRASDLMNIPRPAQQDADPLEMQEWLEALDSVFKEGGEAFRRLLGIRPQVLGHGRRDRGKKCWSGPRLAACHFLQYGMAMPYYRHGQDDNPLDLLA